MLSQMYTLIERQLAVYTKLAGRPSPSYGIGAKDIFNHKDTPRISWVPIGGPVLMPKARSNDFDNPRPLWQRNFQSAAYLWTADIDSVNELENHLVASLDSVFHGGYRIVSEKWDVSGDQDAGSTIVLVFEVQLRFLDEKLPVAQFDQIALNAEVTS